MSVEGDPFGYQSAGAGSGDVSDPVDCQLVGYRALYDACQMLRFRQAGRLGILRGCLQQAMVELQGPDGTEAERIACALAVLKMGLAMDDQELGGR